MKRKNSTRQSVRAPDGVDYSIAAVRQILAPAALERTRPRRLKFDEDILVNEKIDWDFELREKHSRTRLDFQWEVLNKLFKAFKVEDC